MGPMVLIPPERALPGRQNPMQVSAKHYVLGNQMLGPSSGWYEGCHLRQRMLLGQREGHLAAAGRWHLFHCRRLCRRFLPTQRTRSAVAA